MWDWLIAILLLLGSLGSGLLDLYPAVRDAGFITMPVPTVITEPVVYPECPADLRSATLPCALQGIVPPTVNPVPLPPN